MLFKYKKKNKKQDPKSHPPSYPSLLPPSLRSHCRAAGHTAICTILFSPFPSSPYLPLFYNPNTRRHALLSPFLPSLPISLSAATAPVRLPTAFSCSSLRCTFCLPQLLLPLLRLILLLLTIIFHFLELFSSFCSPAAGPRWRELQLAASRRTLYSTPDGSNSLDIEFLLLTLTIFP